MSRLSEKRSRSDDQPEEQRTKAEKARPPLVACLQNSLSSTIGLVSVLAIHYYLFRRREVGGGFFFLAAKLKLSARAIPVSISLALLKQRLL